jgi:pilus assembly protein Flp/PilA
MHWSFLMKQLLKPWRQLWRDESGAAAVEYGLLAGLIAVVIATSVTTLGTTLKTVFDNVVKAI